MLNGAGHTISDLIDKFGPDYWEATVGEVYQDLGLPNPTFFIYVGDDEEGTTLDMLRVNKFILKWH